MGYLRSAGFGGCRLVSVGDGVLAGVGGQTHWRASVLNGRCHQMLDFTIAQTRNCCWQLNLLLSLFFTINAFVSIWLKYCCFWETEMVRERDCGVAQTILATPTSILTDHVEEALKVKVFSVWLQFEAAAATVVVDLTSTCWNHLLGLMCHCSTGEIETNSNYDDYVKVGQNYKLSLWNGCTVLVPVLPDWT